VDIHGTDVEQIRKIAEDAGSDLLRELLQMTVQQLMSAEVDARCGAPYGVPSPDRVNQRNGHRTRRWDTRVGSIDLAIPKLRQGTYYPEWLLVPRTRSEKALTAVVAEAYLSGVSTRRVEDLAQSLGIESLSKSQVSDMAKSLDEHVEAFRSRDLSEHTYPYLWLDATCVKVREGGRVVNVAVVLAIGVSMTGHREVLGMDIVTVEDGAGWTAFLRSLTARGLRGVKLAISDAHCGIKDAIAACLPGAAWQRCRTHFMRNVLGKVPKSAQSLVAGLVRSVFSQPTPEAVHAQYERVIEQLTGHYDDVADMLINAREEILAFTTFPKQHWRQIWSNNPLERQNKEIKRRTRVIGIFPNRSSITRLVGALLAEQNDEWATSRRYMSPESLARTRMHIVPASTGVSDDVADTLELADTAS
jgi:transposase-like protein